LIKFIKEDLNAFQRKAFISALVIQEVLKDTILTNFTLGKVLMAMRKLEIE